MSVLDKLPSGEPLRLLREMEQINREIKSDQFIGSTSVVTDRLFTADLYDVSVPSSGARDVLVEFIPNDLTFGGAFCYQLVVVADPDLAYPSIIEAERQRVVNDRQQWIIYTQISGTRNYKLYFLIAGAGTFTTNLI